ncbi:E3 ubiquitin-protein ligase PRT1 [Apostasia shenzhenica]|uniref:E3 ubiquitin-protein ligase PRT1 n=1 Tax=Apostasia shenzhenica TaxID=1088818 RepID=A0A2I0BBE2_9ASPA|nr:E3 ubiquitin-protein ligase PRT1 [Apostasia shenzhenica]
MAAGEDANEAAGPSFLVSLTGEETLEDSYRSSFQCCICFAVAVGNKLLGIVEAKLLGMLEEKLDLLYKPVVLDGKRSGAIRNVKDSYGYLEDSRPDSLRDFSFRQNGWKYEVLKNISLDDVLCGLCKELLFQPILLNCGHVFCESCLAGERSEGLKCHVCEILHPGEFPNICLDLEHFLEEQFPREYTSRKEIAQQTGKVRYRCREPSAKSYLEFDFIRAIPFSTGRKRGSFPVERRHAYFSSVSTEKLNAKASICFKEGRLSLDEDFSRVHVGVGCDSCGMYPIVGKRYKCKDCIEAIGFDLCESCYSTRSKLPGRFNQQHTPDHQFELDESHMLSRIFLFASPSMEDLSEDYVSADDPEQNDNIVSNSNANIHANDENENENNHSDGEEEIK